MILIQMHYFKEKIRINNNNNNWLIKEINYSKLPSSQVLKFNLIFFKLIKQR